jgi:hypothetical protein
MRVRTGSCNSCSPAVSPSCNATNAITFSPWDRNRQTNHTSLADRRMAVQGFLHFLWRDVGVAADDDLLDASFEPKETVGISPHQVSGAQLARVKGRCGGSGIIPIPHTVCGALHLQFANASVSYHLGGQRVQHGAY